jgi:hypothetical protein
VWSWRVSRLLPTQAASLQRFSTSSEGRKRQSMADEKKSFAELLNDAPLAAGENTVRLVGLLARSSDHKKFVLGLGENQSVTLDIDAVKDYRVLSGMVGQLIIEVEVDRHRLPAPAPPPLPYVKDPAVDLPRATVQEWTTVYGPTTWSEPTAAPNFGNPGWGVYGDPWASQGLVPFALAAARQAPQHVIGAMAAPRLSVIPKYSGEGTVSGVVFKTHEHTLVGTGWKDTTAGPEDW